VETKRQKERCRKRKVPLYIEEENVVHISLKYNEMQRWIEQFVDKWLHINEEIANKKIISCNKIVELKK
jgi:hypothetical protein